MVCVQVKPGEGENEGCSGEHGWVWQQKQQQLSQPQNYRYLLATIA
jgi:hypothetical protein